MKQVILNVPEKKFSFFMELINSLGFVKEVKEEGPTDAKILEDLAEAVKEVNLMKAGKLKGIPAKDLINEL